MRVPGESDSLLTALAELAAVGGDDDRVALDTLRGRLAGRRLRVLVAGEAKRGKSTLVNALLGRPVRKWSSSNCWPRPGPPAPVPAWPHPLRSRPADG